MIFKGYMIHGSSWSKISKDLPGRTENSVKNRFYSTVRKLFSDNQMPGNAKKQSKEDKNNDENQIKNMLQMHFQNQ